MVFSGFHVNSFIVIQNDHKVHDLFDWKHTFSDQTTNMNSTTRSDKHSRSDTKKKHARIMNKKFHAIKYETNYKI